MTVYSKWELTAITGGAALTVIEVYGAVSYLVSQSQPNYLVAGGAVVTIVASILPILAGRSWANGRYLLAVLLWAALAPALSVIVCAAVERTGSANDNANRGRQEVAQKIALARDAEKDAKAEVDRLAAKADAECSTVKNPKADPRGPLCRAAEERADQSRKRLEAARASIAQVGVAQRDPLASRIAAVLPVSEAAASLYQPLVLPLSISALGLLLIASGAHHPKKRRKVKGRKGKRKRRRSRPAARPSVRANNVVPLRKRA